MTQKKLYVISLTVVTVIIAILLFTIAFRISASSFAKERLAEEIAALEKSTEQITDSNKELQDKITEIDTELSTKNTVNNYYMEYKKVHDSLIADISSLKEKSSDLDKQIEEKRGELESSSGISEGKRGKSYSLKKGETYSCPDKIPAGRYTVSGSGTFTVMSATGKVRLSQNLDVSYDNSYTFNLAEKERIRVSGDVTITELK